jgi:hypothetical protein
LSACLGLCRNSTSISVSFIDYAILYYCANQFNTLCAYRKRRRQGKPIQVDRDTKEYQTGELFISVVISRFNWIVSFSTEVKHAMDTKWHSFFGNVLKNGWCFFD